MTDEYGLGQDVRQPFSTTVLVVLSIGVLYFVIGYAFGELDDLVFTAVPAFLVALLVAIVLNRFVRLAER
jgi:hypothetical protein